MIYVLVCVRIKVAGKFVTLVVVDRGEKANQVLIRKDERGLATRIWRPG